MMKDIKQAQRDAGVLMDNIKIAVRLRPTVHKYEQAGKSCVEMVQGDEDGECTVKVRHPKTSNTRNFSVDTCFNSYDSGDASGTQAHVSSTVADQSIADVLDGYNSTVMAFGQTGAGKTHSTFGRGGIAQRAIVSLFEQMDARGMKAIVEIGIVELYNERVSCLLTNDPEKKKAQGKARGLTVSESSTGGVHILGQTTRSLIAAGDAEMVLMVAMVNRTIAATNKNINSSRAHTVMTLTITTERQSGAGTELEEGQEKDDIRVAQYTLIDLAGSERLSKKDKRTGKVSRDRMLEGGVINRSLLALTGLLQSLAAKNKTKGGRSPRSEKEKDLGYLFRRSKLTRLLLGSFSGTNAGNKVNVLANTLAGTGTEGNRESMTTRDASTALHHDPDARVYFVACLSPSSLDYRASLQTMETMMTARRILLQPEQMGFTSKALFVKEMEIELSKADAEFKGRMFEGGLGSYVHADLTLRIRRLNSGINDWFDDCKQEQLDQMEAIKEDTKSPIQRLRRSPGSQQRGGVGGAPDGPCLISLNEDHELSRIVRYGLPEGSTVVSREWPAGELDEKYATLIALGSADVKSEHMVITNTEGGTMLSVVISSPDALVKLNGTDLPNTAHVELHHRDRLIIGLHHVFEVHLPSDPNPSNPPIEAPAEVDWQFAIKEANADVLSSLTDSSGMMSLNEEAEGGATAETARFDGKVMKICDMAREACYISDKLTRGFTFKPILIAKEDDLYSLLDDEHESGEESGEGRTSVGGKTTPRLRGGSVSSGRRETGRLADSLQIDVVVKVKCDASKMVGGVTVYNSATMLWDIDMLSNRLDLMREMNECFADNNEDVEAVMALYPEDDDPFFEPPQHVQIGSAHVFLEPLMYEGVNDTK